MNKSLMHDRNTHDTQSVPRSASAVSSITRRPTWWWLLAAFLAFAVIVTGAFVWQRETRMTSQKIVDELVSLDPSITRDELESKGYTYGGKAAYGWQLIDSEDFPVYQNERGTSSSDRITKFINDVRAGRQSVLRLVIDGTAPSVQRAYANGEPLAYDDSSAKLSVRVLWFDPNIDADWAEKDNASQPATVHHDGKGQIREWWWRDGEIVTSDKRFSRGIARDDTSGKPTYILKHQPAIPADPDSSNTIIMRYDENLISLGS